MFCLWVHRMRETAYWILAESARSPYLIWTALVLMQLYQQYTKSQVRWDTTRSCLICHTCVHYFLTVVEEATKLHSQDEQFRRRVKDLTTMTKKTTELTNTTTALAQVVTHNGHLVSLFISSLSLFLEHTIHQWACSSLWWRWYNCWPGS